MDIARKFPVWLTLGAWLGATGLGGTPALAQQTYVLVEQPKSTLLPPAPHERPPWLAGDFHVDLVFPISDDPLCPDGAACVFGEGGGLGASVQRRWPNGWAILLGYDIWFLNGNGVYEMSVMQMLHFGFRYLFLQEARAHPFVGASIGATTLGDGLRIATVGGGGDVRLGVEIELTETLALSLALPWRIFSMAAFTTPRDGVERSQEGGVNVALAFELGIVLIEAP